MKFGEVPVDQAEGGVLAHSIQVGEVRLRKGRVLSATDLRALGAAGATKVVVARLDEADVAENDAALRVAKALVGARPQGVELTKPFTGRVNIIAKSAGVAGVDAELVNALNAKDPMITCATVAPFTRLAPGAMLATIKIISYAVKADAVDAAELSLQRASAPALGLIETTLNNARLIVTKTKGGVASDKGVAAVEARLTALGMTLPTVVDVPHRSTDISDALQVADEDMVLILTASATSDIADVGPDALRQAGGTVTRFGMPVDPGNLLFLGDLKGRPVIGLPGCARSPALNGADWILERVACGIPVTDVDISAMGVGGLLKEIPQRPQPRRG